MYHLQKTLEKQVIWLLFKHFSSCLHYWPIDWGIIGSWNKSYSTMDKCFEATELKAFSDLFSKGFIFRGLLPVYWSTCTKSAIAESELEYNPEHKSCSIYLKISLTRCSDRLVKKLSYNCNVYAIIWTTNPWTIFSNEAVAYNSDVNYVLLQSQTSGDVFLISKYFSDRLKSLLSKEKLQIVDELIGDDLTGCFYRHPTRVFCEKPFLPSSHVYESIGTGLVHIAPCHGKEDFEFAKKHNLPLNSLVDESGCFIREVGSELAGLNVLDEGNASVVKLLEPITIHKEVISHSYPYDWRTKKPVIIQLSNQWFINTEKISHLALEEYKNVNVIPASHKLSMLPFLSQRPNWCISRQRAWGVPIPVLFKKADNSPIVDHDLIDHIASRVASEGSDFWFTEACDQLIPKWFWKKWALTSHDVYKSTEVFDVWFDSGLSWLCVLNSENYSRLPQSNVVADTYLEGHDQFRGWFSSSLLLSIALTGRAPFKNLVVHGFVADSQGHKMSKSLGNGITPKELISNQHGCIDIMRRWVCYSGLNSQCRLGSKEIDQNTASYKGLRNSLRFMTGNLYDFCPVTYLNHNEEINSIHTNYSLSRLILEMTNYVITKDNPNTSCLSPLDRSVLYYLSTLISNSLHIYYPQFRYNVILAEIDQFLSHLSSVYITSVKDRLYFSNPNDPCRRNTQTVFWLTVECLKALLAPILPYLMEEVESVTWDLLSTQLNDFCQSTTLLERYSSLSLHDYCSIDKSKPCSDWILCLLAMSQWDKFKDDLSFVNFASSLFHSLINSLPKDRKCIPSTNPLSNAHVHISIPAKCQESYHMLKALHPLESCISVSSDLCYILRAASTSWSIESHKEGVLNSSEYYKFTINDMQVFVKFPLENQTIKCQRCHRYTNNGVEKTLCPRCMQIINNPLAVKI
ncbi:Isoleucine--tRNA ligase, mitochondrial [Schistosoma japonicum]|nr:Isoleucine--tRNA ligase, mitochondrial [Schistosoma japonicum]KAH8860252.1 Isoleucine--tRNA ligase, mitochondrial [Schistosoma japonicum]KAH8860253.1 Isoleucine--tRNA ligase, mitochondrial [Schistosoma japonicum]KAH8860254.1 Isoleucine--tRNA ligase, mitochondrial [Schistosoma japonicum]